MATVCSCDAVLGNTGLSSCPAIPQIARKLILVPYYDASGNINELDLTNPSAPAYGTISGSALDASFFSDLINASDKNERWYPMPLMKNVENVREDSVFESFEDGTQEKIRDGVANFTAQITKMAPAFLAQIEKAACTPIGAYIVDNKNNLIGYSTEEDKLQPIKIDEKTWNPLFNYATDTAVPKITLNFQWDLSVMDSSLGLVSANEISTSMSSLIGLLDIKAKSLAANLATEVEVEIVTFYGSVGEPDYVEDLVLADFDVWNETIGASATPSAVTEVSAGTYQITIAAQTASDVLHVRVDKTGLDDTELRKTTVSAL